MPRVRVVCQNCGRQLSYLEMAPRWTVRATCPSCHAVTVATLSATGEPCQVTTPISLPAKQAVAGSSRTQMNEQSAG